MSSDKHRHGKLLKDTSNAYVKSRYQFPKRVMDAYHSVSRWNNEPSNIMNVIGTSDDGLTFAHTAEPSPVITKWQ